MFNFRKWSLISLSIILIFFLAACDPKVETTSGINSSSTNNQTDDTKNTTDNHESTTNNTGGTTTNNPEQTTNNEPDEPNLGNFAEMLENATEISYTIYSETVDKTTEDTDSYTFKYAFKQNKEAFSVTSDNETFTYVIDPSFVYWIINNESEKQVIKMINENTSSYEMYKPDFSYLLAFVDLDYEAKTENVMVGNLSTTCYEYIDNFGFTYKYYVVENDIIVKIEFEDNSTKVIWEYKELKFTNIDTTLFIIPTESDGYQIIDQTIELPNIDSFKDQLENATEISYTLYMETFDKETNEILITLFKYAYMTNREAVSISSEEGIYRYVIDQSFMYWITDDDINGKTVMKLLNDDPDQLDIYRPNLDFIIDYEYYYFESKTENVMVGNVSTTCYEFVDVDNYLYRYYIDENDFVVKAEYEDTFVKTSWEFRDFKLTNIDTTLFIIPTEADGYEVLDYTTF